MTEACLVMSINKCEMPDKHAVINVLLAVRVGGRANGRQTSTAISRAYRLSNTQLSGTIYITSSHQSAR